MFDGQDHGRATLRTQPIVPENTKLGFVGIGYMGGLIAQWLLQAGFPLTAYDRNRSKAEQLVRYGGVVAQSIAEAASNSDVLLSCLSDDEAVLGVYLGPGALANLHPGSIVIEMSTVSPKTAQKHFHLGPSASGATIKLVTNTLLGTGMQAIAEAVALAEKAGLERNRLLEVLSQRQLWLPPTLESC
jgi:3-hydroxyisobutyrate dehydrogenase-like beta-hydroxyacid dehydrogenase